MLERFQITKKFTFEAAHRLPYNDGKCKRLHGHSWKGEVVVESSSLHDSGPQSGMVMDFSALKAAFRPMVEKYLDHHYLNETLPLDSPTSEAIARWIYRHLRPKVHGLVRVSIEETCTSRCDYFPQK